MALFNSDNGFKQALGDVADVLLGIKETMVPLGPEWLREELGVMSPQNTPGMASRGLGLGTGLS